MEIFSSRIGVNILKVIYFPGSIFLLIILVNLTILFKGNEIFSKHSSDMKGFLKEVRCLTCPGQSVADSLSDFSTEVKLFVQKQYREKITPKEIRERLVEKYGEEILFTTPKNYYTILLWELPFFCLFLGFLLVRKLTTTQKTLPIN